MASKKKLRVVRSVHIGDMHWGGPATDQLSKEFDGVIVKWLTDPANQYDFIVQHGDWFDKRLPLDSDASKAAMRYMMKLVSIADERGVPLRITKGTCSHEYEQLDNFRQLEVELPHFRVIRTAEIEQLLPDFQVLWMPEEYPKDYNDFYEPFFFDGEEQIVHDMICGHGEIDVAVNWSTDSESEHPYGGTPLHEAEDLLEGCRGAIAFGHVHPEFEYKGRLFYPGSFSRWVQGEEGEKSFSVVTSTERADGTWKIDRERVVNNLALTYRAVLALAILDPSDAPDVVVRKLREAAVGCEKLRVDFEGYPIGVEDAEIVRGALVQDRNVAVRLSARVRPGQEEAAELEEGVEEAEEAAESPFAYLSDRGIPVAERLSRYASQCSGLEVSLDDVLELTAPPAK